MNKYERIWIDIKNDAIDYNSPESLELDVYITSDLVYKKFIKMVLILVSLMLEVSNTKCTNKLWVNELY